MKRITRQTPIEEEQSFQGDVPVLVIRRCLCSLSPIRRACALNSAVRFQCDAASL